MDCPLAISMSRVVNLGVAAVNHVEKPDYASDWEQGAKVTHVFC